MKISLKLVLIFLFSLLLVNCKKDVVYVHTTLTLQPNAADGKDAIISSLAPNTNYGTHADFAAIATTNSGTPTTGRSLIHFDFSTIPANAIIDSVKLHLYGYISPANGGHQTLSGTNTSTLQRATESWDESTVTWNNQPSSTDLDEVILSMSTSETQNYILDVTESAKYMIENPSLNYGYIFELITESYWRRLVFGSSDNTNSSLHPKMEVYYSVAQ